jgi:hypothetical protein
MQDLMDATADGSECTCDKLPHREQFIEQSGPAQPILARHLKIVAQPQPASVVN